MAAKEFGVPAKYRVLSKPMLWIYGFIDPRCWRVVRNAVSKRFSISVRFDKVRARVWIFGNTLFRRGAYRRRLLQGESLR